MNTNTISHSVCRNILLILLAALVMLFIRSTPASASYCGEGYTTCCLAWYDSCVTGGDMYSGGGAPCRPGDPNCYCSGSCGSATLVSCANGCGYEQCDMSIPQDYAYSCPGYTAPPPPDGGGGGNNDCSAISNVGCYCDCSYACDGCSCDPECGTSGGGDVPPPPPPPTATPTPTPLPANFAVREVYLTDSAGNKHYNFSEDDRIYWHLKVLNNGNSQPSSPDVFINLYQNQPDQVSITSAKTQMYIKTDSNWSPNVTRTWDSAVDGSRRVEFEKSYSFMRSGGLANNGAPLYARVFVDPDNQVNESPGSNLTDNQLFFRYIVGPPPDLIIDSFVLTNGRGEVTSQFEPGENIFPKVTIRNRGGTTAISRDPNNPHTYTQFYRNQPNIVAKGTAGDTSVILRTGEFARGAVYSYYCRPVPGDRCDRYTEEKAWDIATKGYYTARVFVDYDNTIVESNYTNNQVTIRYSVGYILGGYAFDDLNRNAIKDSNEPTLPNIRVQLYRKDAAGTYTTRIGSQVTDSNGYYEFEALSANDYLVMVNPSDIPSGKRLSTPRERYITLPPSTKQLNIGFAPAFIILGNIFTDTNDNKIKDADESNYTFTPVIKIDGTSQYVTTGPDGTYRITDVQSGTRRITLELIPPGYFVIHPRNGPPPSFTIQLDQQCLPGSPNPAGTCTGDTLENLNFALKNGQPWFQALGLDVRFDQGVRNPIPPDPNEACGPYALLNQSSSTPGILFSGNRSASLGLGQAGKDPFNRIVGNDVYPELFTPANGSIKTSYAYIASVIQQSLIPTKPLSSVCSLTDCTLPSNLPNGVYTATGDVNLNSFTAPLSSDIIFLINGNLTFNGTLHVPISSTVFYTVAKSIFIAPTLGSTPTCPPAEAGDVEGFFSADENFEAPSIASCDLEVSDKQLSIQGAIVVNAAQKGGDFINKRTLCTENISYPSVTLKERPDFILNAPDILKVPNYIWQEIAP